MGVRGGGGGGVYSRILTLFLVKSMQISCETAKELKTTLLLGNVSEWDEEQVLEHKWLLRCMGPDDMDDDDVDHLAEIMAGGGMQEDADLPPSVVSGCQTGTVHSSGNADGKERKETWGFTSTETIKAS